MTFKDSEGIRLLADHIKSIWALSAGGIAFGSGLLGFISKDISIPWYGYLICLVFVFGGLCAYTFSVWRGILAHKRLADEVFKTESRQVLVTDIDAQKAIKAILTIYDQSRTAFFIGCLVLAVGVLGFVTWNNIFRSLRKTSYVEVSLTNGNLTHNSRSIQIDTLSFRITDPRTSQSNVIEIRDLVYKGRILETTP